MKCVLLTFLAFEILTLSAQKKIMYEDIARQGIPFSKDPHAVKFENRYIMYYSVPPFADSTNPIKSWNIGITWSNDLIEWENILILPGEQRKRENLVYF